MPNSRFLAFLIVIIGLNTRLSHAQDTPIANGKEPARVEARPDASSKLSPMEQNWLDLEKQQEDEVIPALLKMATTPKESIEFLKSRLKPLKIDPEGVTELLVKLDSEDEKVWKAAFKELEYLDPRLAIDIQTLAENVTTKPLRQRLMEVLLSLPAGTLGDKNAVVNHNGRNVFELTVGNAIWMLPANASQLTMARCKPKWIQATRAVMFLEQFHTPEAFALLREMATGHPDAGPTIAAVAAINRIEGKPQVNQKKPKSFLDTPVGGPQ